jgi:hypothetical protein
MPKMQQIHLQCFPERDMRYPGSVSIATYGEDAEFEVMAEHWHAALKGAVAKFRRNKGKDRIFWTSIGGNYAAFPIIYNYRHVLELYLKGILVTGEPALLLAGEPGIRGDIFNDHSFRKLRPDIERLFDVLSVPYDLGTKRFKTKTDFGRLLSDMDAMEIRYPINQKRQPAMGNRFMCFNIFEFAAIMDEVLDALNGLRSAIGYEVDARCHAAHEAREAAWANYDPPDYDPLEYEPEEYYGD